ncbi:hypothetical protein EBZ35_06125, partial [bacterium]|nr:hypothetical protein [bacterium]
MPTSQTAYTALLHPITHRPNGPSQSPVDQAKVPVPSHTPFPTNTHPCSDAGYQKTRYPTNTSKTDPHPLGGPIHT